MYDPYAPCPCGSGKKFKWCCQAIHVQVDKAVKLDEDGQHEAALKMMEQVTVEHATNAEAWGRYAQLLYQNDRVEDAESALDKAFAQNPNYPFGLYLRGRFRHFEGEIAGALLLFRKSVEAYDPNARETVAHIYTLIFDCEMKLNRPIAAHAAAKLAYRMQPVEDLRVAIESVFTDKNPNLPPVAREDYGFLALPAGASAAQAWKQASESGKLEDAARAFTTLTQQHAQEPAVWYNLALTHAWLGRNAQAIEALNQYLTLEQDEANTTNAWALAQVLACGQGMEDQSDFVEYSMIAAIRDPQSLVNFFTQLEQQHLMTAVRVDQEQGILTSILIDPPPPALTPELAANQASHLGAYLMFMGTMLRIWGVNKEALDRIVASMREKIWQALAEVTNLRSPCRFTEILSEGLTFPRSLANQQEVEAKIVAGIEKFLEEKWVHRPLKALDGVPPMEAAASPLRRKKLLGVLRFLQECAALMHLPYEFERLRRKLGLMEGGAAKIEPAAPAGPDLHAMSADQLAGVAHASLSEKQLEDGFQSALKLDDRNLAGKFAQELVARPSQTDKPDRYLFHNHLIQLALSQGDTALALDRVNEGQKDDCEHNQGKRRNDFELRRGTILVKRSELDEAQKVFDSLIQRAPAELRYRGSAAEALLSAKQNALARKFAEEGLAEARKQNNRDSEAHFKELVSASQR